MPLHAHSPASLKAPLPGPLWRGRRQAVAWLAVGGATLLSACDQLAPAGGGNSPSFKGIDLTGAAYAQGFELIDFNGQVRRLTDFTGRVVMLYFGFVQCPDVCPTALTRAAEVMQQLGPQAADVQVIFVTVDHERDTPDMLREYMGAFDPSFLALTGSADQIAQAAKEFRVYYKKVPTGSSYTMDHTALSYLFDRQGRIRVALRHEQTADEYAADIRALLAEGAA